MRDVIAIIVTILIGIAAKWLEDRPKKNKDKRKSAERHDSRSFTPSAPARLGMNDQFVFVETATPPAASSAAPKHNASSVPAFEEGQCAVPHDEYSDMAEADNNAADEALAAHYQRWRQAIIDAQIITPKFKE